jgi:hypothetical protein
MVKNMIIEFYLNVSPILRSADTLPFHVIIKQNTENNIPRVKDYLRVPDDYGATTGVGNLYTVHDVEWAGPELNRVRIYLWDFKQ